MARDMNGTTGYVNTGVGVEITSTFTIACWFFADVVTGGPRLMSRWSSGKQQRYLLQLSSSKLLLAILGSDAAGQTIAGATTLSTGTWYHACGVYIPSTSLTVYLNGSQDGQLTTAVKSGLATTAPARALCFGADNNAANFFNGRIAECGVWNASLNTKEIGALANGVLPCSVRPSSLKGYWPLLGDSTEPDYSGNRNSGTVIGTAPAINHPRVQAGLL